MERRPYAFKFIGGCAIIYARARSALQARISVKWRWGNESAVPFGLQITTRAPAKWLRGPEVSRTGKEAMRIVSPDRRRAGLGGEVWDFMDLAPTWGYQRRYPYALFSVRIRGARPRAPGFKFSDFLYLSCWRRAVPPFIRTYDFEGAAPIADPPFGSDRSAPPIPLVGRWGRKSVDRSEARGSSPLLSRDMPAPATLRVYGRGRGRGEIRAPLRIAVPYYSSMERDAVYRHAHFVYLGATQPCTQVGIYMR